MSTSDTTTLLTQLINPYGALDGRDVLQTLQDVDSIANPALGGLFYCLATGKYYKITALTSGSVGAYPTEVANYKVAAYEEFVIGNDIRARSFTFTSPVISFSISATPYYLVTQNGKTYPVDQGLSVEGDSYVLDTAIYRAFENVGENTVYTWRLLYVGGETSWSNKEIASSSYSAASRESNSSLSPDWYTALTLTAVEEGSTVSLSIPDGLDTYIVYRTKYMGSFSPYTSDTVIPLDDADDYVQFENLSYTLSDVNNFCKFSMSGSIAASGNTQSLLNYSEACDSWCFSRLFYGCTSLVHVSDSLLPSQVLADHCYTAMFYGCTALREAPDLPAQYLEVSCYEHMFSGCTSLGLIVAGFSSWTPTEVNRIATTGWLLNTAESGTFIKLCELPVKRGDSYIPVGWAIVDDCPESSESSYASEGDSSVSSSSSNTDPSGPSSERSLGPEWYTPLTFTAQENGVTIALVIEEGFPTVSGIEYNSSNSWLSYSPGTEITMNNGDSVKFRNSSEQLNHGSYDYAHFVITGKAAASGNIQSLLNYIDYCKTNCFYRLFYNCSSLVTAPDLLTETLAPGCYYQMFSGCSSLSSLRADFITWLQNTTTNWLYGVPASGVFYKRCLLPYIYGSSYIPTSWTVSDDCPSSSSESPDDPLRFTALESVGAKISLNIVTGSVPTQLRYRTNNIPAFQEYTPGLVITLQQNEYVEFDNLLSTLSTETTNRCQFFITIGRVAASGSVQSLLNYSDACPPYCFNHLFADCGLLTTPPRLPSTSLSNACYYAMFYRAGITVPPELPATTVYSYCYSHMFEGCQNLAIAPELPAGNAATGCYYQMFSGCSSLTEAPELPSVVGASQCYSFMFGNCVGLVKGPTVLRASSLFYECYAGMFYNCPSLLTPPDLSSVVNMDAACYRNMFQGCVSLQRTPSLPMKTLTESCYSYMFAGCSSIKQAALPATTLATGCYTCMFAGCSQLSTISVSFTSWGDSATGTAPYTQDWVFGVSPNGVFYAPSALPANIKDNSHIPPSDQWRVVTTS